MLQASEIQKRFTHLEQTIEKASQACHADATVPSRLRKYLLVKSPERPVRTLLMKNLQL